MAKLTYAQQIAFSKTVVQFLKDNTNALKEAGFDPAGKLSTLEPMVDSAIEQDARQEELKAELNKTTAKAVGTMTKAYTLASSMIDAMVGVIGKDQPLSRRFRQIRDQMIKEAARGKKHSAGGGPSSVR